MLTNILQAIGNTPLLRLNLSQDLPGKVWLKLENRNPGGSIKDRVAFTLSKMPFSGANWNRAVLLWRPPAAIWASA